MTALDTKALLEGVIAGPWSVNTTDEEIQVRSFHPSMICVMDYTDDIALKTAALIASAPRLARRVIELEELLGEAFDFLGGCDDAAELRDRILAALNGEQTA